MMVHTQRENTDSAAEVPSANGEALFFEAKELLAAEYEAADLHIEAQQIRDYEQEDGDGDQAIIMTAMAKVIAQRDAAMSMVLPEAGQRFAKALQSIDAQISDTMATKAENFLLRNSLSQIARMKLFPDDKINRTTLQAAIAIARKACQPVEPSSETAEGEAASPICTKTNPTGE